MYFGIAAAFECISLDSMYFCPKRKHASSDSYKRHGVTKFPASSKEASAQNGHLSIAVHCPVRAAITLG